MYLVGKVNEEEDKFNRIRQKEERDCKVRGKVRAIRDRTQSSNVCNRTP